LQVDLAAFFICLKCSRLKSGTVASHPFQKQSEPDVLMGPDGVGVSAFSIQIAQALDGSNHNNWGATSFRGLHSAAFWQTRQTLAAHIKQTVCGCLSAYGTWLFIFLPINVAATPPAFPVLPLLETQPPSPAPQCNAPPRPTRLTIAHQPNHPTTDFECVALKIGRKKFRCANEF